MAFCQNCGKSTPGNEVLCDNCKSGNANLQDSGHSHFEDHDIYDDMNFLPIYYQAEFAKIYDSDEVYRGKWNWNACILSFFWMISKGLWKPYILLVGANLGYQMVMSFILAAADNNSSPVFFRILLPVYLILLLGMFVVSGIRGNYLYYCKIVYDEDLWI